MRASRAVIAVGVGVLIAATDASGAALDGEFGIAGGVNEVQLGRTSVDFGPFFPVLTGGFQVTYGDGSFSGLTGGVIRDLPSLVPGPTGVDDFVEFDGRESWNFRLEQIEAGVGPAPCTDVPGETCTPAGSPYTFFNLDPVGSTVAFMVAGTATNQLGERSVFTGTITSRLDQSGATAFGLMADDEMAFVRSSWSAEFMVTPESQSVPEPGSTALLGLAFTGLAIVLRRRP